MNILVQRIDECDRLRLLADNPRTALQFWWEQKGLLVAAGMSEPPDELPTEMLAYYQRGLEDGLTIRKTTHQEDAMPHVGLARRPRHPGRVRRASDPAYPSWIENQAAGKDETAPTTTKAERAWAWMMLIGGLVAVSLGVWILLLFTGVL